MSGDHESLAQDVRAALVRAGLSLHDLDAPDGSPAAVVGGVVVIAPLLPRDPGVLVLWEVHDDLAKPAVNAEDANRLRDPALILDRRVRAVMQKALREILLASGFQLEVHPCGRFAQPGLYVTGRR